MFARCADGTMGECLGYRMVTAGVVAGTPATKVELWEPTQPTRTSRSSTDSGSCGAPPVPLRAGPVGGARDRRAVGTGGLLLEPFGVGNGIVASTSAAVRKQPRHRSWSGVGTKPGVVDCPVMVRVHYDFARPRRQAAIRLGGLERGPFVVPRRWSSSIDLSVVTSGPRSERDDCSQHASCERCDSEGRERGCYERYAVGYDHEQGHHEAEDHDETGQVSLDQYSSEAPIQTIEAGLNLRGRGHVAPPPRHQATAASR